MNTKSTSFLVFVNGAIENAEVNDFDDLYLRFSYVIGKDWKICSGLEEGTTQIAHKSVQIGSKIVFNFPLEATFRSTNPFGWPQLVISGYGLDVFGNDIVRGYGTTHIPISPGRHRIRIPLFVPRSSSRFQQLLAWFFGRRPEFIDPKVIAFNAGREIPIKTYFIGKRHLSHRITRKPPQVTLETAAAAAVAQEVSLSVPLNDSNNIPNQSETAVITSPLLEEVVQARRATVSEEEAPKDAENIENFENVNETLKYKDS
ncbi:unnamed protein product [Rotaria sp. Silwood2]|nr:unnamed protein product [Rotaria sp. Silwood2]